MPAKFRVEIDEPELRLLVEDRVVRILQAVENIFALWQDIYMACSRGDIPVLVPAERIKELADRYKMDSKAVSELFELYALVFGLDTKIDVERASVRLITPYYSEFLAELSELAKLLQELMERAPVRLRRPVASAERPRISNLEDLFRERERVRELVLSCLRLLLSLCPSENPLSRSIFMLRSITPKHARELLGLDRSRLAKTFDLLGHGLRAMPVPGDEDYAIFGYPAGSLGETFLKLWARLYRFFARDSVRFLLKGHPDPREVMIEQTLETLRGLGWRAPSILIDFYYYVRERDPSRWRGYFVLYIREGVVNSIHSACLESVADYFERVIKEYNVPARNFLDELMPGVIAGLIDLDGEDLELGRTCMLKVRPLSIDLLLQFA